MKRERQRDERGRFMKGNGGTMPSAEWKQTAESKQTAAERLMAYAMEAPDRLRAMAEDPETPIKLKLEIERFFFELAYGKGNLAGNEPGSIQFEGELEKWSR